MLNPIHHQAYEVFLQALLQIRETVDAPDALEGALQDDFAQVQQVFSTQVLGLTGEGLELNVVSRWRSLQTEIHRAMRLLEADVMRWKIAQKGETSEQRREEMRDRVNQLIGYCQALLNC